MIQGFEQYTAELNDYDKEILLPLLIAGLQTKIGVEKAITNAVICEMLTKKGYKITPEKVRKIIHVIRAQRLVTKLVATSKGYYIATTKRELIGYLNSLIGRKSALDILINAVEKDLTDTNNK